ncbi:sigma-70 family RNA polymerase sigma factor [Actinacidiphila glaucinigra]|uniref:sigma-70 family RNA polymerase sigma factor n=1 Tax=Actinacidiphila glaucinigra TaxID=235986 RepID=UPI00366FD65E
MGSAHRAWLEPVRDTYLHSGLTLNELSGRVRFAKSKLSELLRGTGLYPRWQILSSLSVELQIPQWPLFLLWKQAAVEAHKSPEWIERSGEKTAVATSNSVAPLDHQAFRELVESDFCRYAQVFLDGEQLDAAVSDTFAILWLRWNDALGSPDLRRFAWQALRATVMSRTPHLDGRPDFSEAVFDTLALRNLADTADPFHQVAESLELFAAMSRMPDHQLDVMVLRHLCGLPPEDVSALLGVPLATVQSDERHAVHFLESVICPPPDTEGNTP